MILLPDQMSDPVLDHAYLRLQELGYGEISVSMTERRPDIGGGGYDVHWSTEDAGGKIFVSDGEIQNEARSGVGNGG